MTFHNEYEIQDIADAIDRKAPQARPYARYLLDWVKIVNANSDGWPYWARGSRAGAPLADLLVATLGSLYGGPSAPQARIVTPMEWNKAIGAIKRAASWAAKKNGRPFPVPTLGGPEVQPARTLRATELLREARDLLAAHQRTEPGALKWPATIHVVDTAISMIEKG